tara:strand:- start:857 stop:1477 length:621 start_codon:yes stop_codon:yes gene_type:complete
MKLTNEQLKQIIREELEVVLTNEEAGEIFGDEVQQQLEQDEAKLKEGHCGGPEEEAPPREAGDIVTALEDAMRALGDALAYMRGEHEDALGDVAGELGDEAAVMNVGPMEEASSDPIQNFVRDAGIDAVTTAFADPAKSSRMRTIIGLKLFPKINVDQYKLITPDNTVFTYEGFPRAEVTINGKKHIAVLSKRKKQFAKSINRPMI